jgi:hypothetical protein
MIALELAAAGRCRHVRRVMMVVAMMCPAGHFVVHRSQQAFFCQMKT